MSMRHDYSETRARLLSALDKLDRTRRAVGHTHLPPSGAPGEIIARIDDLDALLQETSAEFQAARHACNQAGRRGLHVVGS
ncbi:MAG: hypothetical protein AB8B85_13545 [Paracoccaceae bacterium]